MFDVRNWERFQFLLDCEHQTVCFLSVKISKRAYVKTRALLAGQNKTILQRSLPPYLKLSIAKTIENHLFSKVLQA
jgi:hypothetical protein